MSAPVSWRLASEAVLRPAYHHALAQLASASPARPRPAAQHTQGVAPHRTATSGRPPLQPLPDLLVPQTARSLPAWRCCQALLLGGTTPPFSHREDVVRLAEAYASQTGRCATIELVDDETGETYDPTRLSPNPPGRSIPKAPWCRHLHGCSHRCAQLA